MTKHYTSTSKNKAIERKPNVVKDIDPDDPDDNAFVLVIKFVFYCDVLFFKKKLLFSPLFSPPSLFFCIPPAPLISHCHPLRPPNMV